MIEQRVEQMLVDACNSVRIKAIKGNANGNIGYPDRIVYQTNTGNIYHVEVKRGKTGYKQTRKQFEWQKRIEKSGGTYFLISGVEEMNSFINEYILLEEK